MSSLVAYDDSDSEEDSSDQQERSSSPAQTAPFEQNLSPNAQILPNAPISTADRIGFWIPRETHGSTAILIHNPRVKGTGGVLVKVKRNLWTVLLQVIPVTHCNTLPAQDPSLHSEKL
ncbi:hypothetical protein FQA47_016399 [Oryzias melastigma]|uniref:Uncharacterized protein n=1 Tax=Oryzias melastigma TaxID=30732 RepID=A0A834F555_ORYME|nr:hypothetical protein FQA47_016399 [Oryzias melastigma]